MAELTTTILIIEDDRQIGRVVQGYLEQCTRLRALQWQQGQSLPNLRWPFLHRHWGLQPGYRRSIDHDLLR